ncbi:MAG: hypothetical protein U0359_24605 [Byssovorax sp.]
MSRRLWNLRRLAAVLAAGACVALTARAEDKVQTGASFLPVYEVLQHPRCQNCHPAGDAPHVGDLGKLHRMNVSRHSPEAGLPCSTCHRDHNAMIEHGPPGAPGWDMPPSSHPSPFEGKSPGALCAQLKDPAKNGGKSVADLHGPMAHDALVLWAFTPGPGRAAPPVSHAELVKRVDRWIAEGAPCPAP